MEHEFVPWVPHADTPFIGNGRSRTQSQIMQMHSLRSVHGSLRKIAHDLEQPTSALVEFQEVDGPSAQNSSEIPDKPSIQRSSVTPETTEGNTMLPSWEHFSVKPRGFSEAPGAGHLNSSAKEAPSQSPAPSHAVRVVADKAIGIGASDHIHALQPVRSVGLDPSSSDMMTCATSAFVSRQFESITRRDIMLEEYDLRCAMLLLFCHATSAMHIRERMSEKRRLREHIALLEENELTHQLTVSEALRAAEEESRSRLQDFQIESMRAMQQEVSRIVSVVEDSSARSSLTWLVMHEERRRVELEMEHGRGLSRLTAEHLSGLQKLLLEFHLYLARSQNISGHRKGDDDSMPTTAEEQYVAVRMRSATKAGSSMKPSTYDPESEQSIAARRLASSSSGVGQSAKKPKDPQIARAYVDDLISNSKRVARDSPRESKAQNNNNSTTSEHKGLVDTQAKTRPAPQTQRDTPRIGKQVNDQVDPDPSKGTKESATRVERLRQKKAAASTRAAAQQQALPAQASPTERSRIVPEAPAASPVASDVTSKKKKSHHLIVEEADKDQGGTSLLAGVPVFENEDEAEARRRVAVARDQLSALGQFEPVWGWMMKSTGVLMSWQRRFFVLTKSGKIKYSAQDPTREDSVRWVHLLNAEDITRVETDVFADTTVRPPTDQYHANCFYVDAVRSHRNPSDANGPKTERFKFCCGNKAELNKWMWALRNATDVVYSLEENGHVERSPLREHFRRMYALLSPLLSSSIQAAKQGQRPEGSEIELPTYRKRVQMEDDIAALEAQQREAYARERQREEEENKKYLISPRTARSPSPPKATLHIL